MVCCNTYPDNFLARDTTLKESYDFTVIRLRPGFSGPRVRIGLPLIVYVSYSNFKFM